MAEVQTPAGASAKDTALMSFAILALFAGIVAFYWYDELALPFRVAMVTFALSAVPGSCAFTSSVMSVAGRPGGNRTPNLRFWRPPLCQLSYWPFPFG